MKIKLSAFGMLSLLLLTLLLVFDFYPNNPFFNQINRYVFWTLLVALGLLVSLNEKSEGSQKDFKQKIALPIYIVGLLLVLTVLGGESSNGLAATQSGFWIVVALCMMDIASAKKSINRT